MIFVTVGERKKTPISFLNKAFTHHLIHGELLVYINNIYNRIYRYPFMVPWLMFNAMFNTMSPRCDLA